MATLVDVITTGLIMLACGLLVIGMWQLAEWLGYLLSNRNR